MQQRGNAHFFHVDVVPPDCPVLRVVGGPLGATNDLQYTQQGRRTGILQLIFDGEEFRKMTEKGTMPAIITALAMVVMSCCRECPRIG
jgi:hypothetical protein